MRSRKAMRDETSRRETIHRAMIYTNEIVWNINNLKIPQIIRQKPHKKKVDDEPRNEIIEWNIRQTLALWCLDLISLCSACAFSFVPFDFAFRSKTRARQQSVNAEIYRCLGGMCSARRSDANFFARLSSSFYVANKRRTFQIFHLPSRIRVVVARKTLLAWHL